MFASLNVYLKNRFCGQVSWESERNRLVFRYVDEYLADPGAEPLSFALPLQADAFDEEVSYNYFANLLPPEVVRRKLEKCLHVSKNGPSAIAVKRSDADLDFPRREVHDLELEVLEVAQAVGLLHQ